MRGTAVTSEGVWERKGLLLSAARLAARADDAVCVLLFLP